MPAPSPHKLYLSLLVAWIVLMVCSTGQAQTTYEALAQRYTLLDEQQQDYLWAKQIFGTLLQVAQVSAADRPTLLVVQGKMPQAAFATLDGFVVLSDRVLAFCKRQAEADTALALVLGHELAHLTHSHLHTMQQLITQTSASYSGTERQSSRDARARRYHAEAITNMEIEADAVAVRYAIMAGYNVPQVLQAADNFFAAYLGAVHYTPVKDGDLFHPSSAVRLEAARAALRRLQHPDATPLTAAHLP